jgi:hypothetical protein
MPLVSNKESVRQGKPSVLAVVEVVAATGIALWLAERHNTIEHLAIASALAPFLLFRTLISTEYTVQAIAKFEIATFWVIQFLAIRLSLY